MNDKDAARSEQLKKAHVELTATRGIQSSQSKEVASLKSRVAEVEQLKVNLAILENWNAEMSEKLKKALADLKVAHNTQEFQSKEVASLYSKATQNESDAKDTRQLKKDIARYITHLDLAYEEFRVYTCSHKDPERLPDGNKSTREHDASSLAWEMFGAWQHDSVFRDEYCRFRAKLYAHHYWHEKYDPGRGNHAWEIKEACKCLQSI